MRISMSGHRLLFPSIYSGPTGKESGYEKLVLTLTPIRMLCKQII